MRKPHWEHVKDLFAPSAWPGESNEPSAYGRMFEIGRPLGSKPVFTRKNDYGFNPQYFAMLAAFRNDGARIFKVGREFGRELAKAKLDIPVTFAPKLEHVLCIEFPDDMVFEQDRDAIGRRIFSRTAYVVSYAPDEVSGFTLVNPVTGQDTPLLRGYRVLLPHYLEDGTLDVGLDTAGVNFTPDAPTLEAAIERSLKFSTVGPNAEVLRFVMKVLVYLQSGEPDLRPLRAPRKPDTENPKKLRRWEKENAENPTVDLTLVGYDWKKPRLFSTDSTSVIGHFRWQPYGTGRTKVKLIWIDEHVRHFKQVAAD